MVEKSSLKRLGWIALVFMLAPGANAIMNGQPVEVADPVALVSVKLTKQYDPMGPTDCSGTRITRNHILTAAHCVSVAKHTVFAGGISFRVIQARAHPEWDDSTDAYDFAVLKVEGAPPLGPVAVIADARDKELAIGDVLTVAGSGYTEVGGDGVLYKTQLRVKTPYYSRTEILTAGVRTGVCGGDSGGGYLQLGPVIKVFGVVSSTVTDDRYGCDDHVFMANVMRASDWIRDSIRGMEEPWE